MSTQQLIAQNKQGAEIHRGAALCKQKCHELLDELNLPKGILPLNNLTEMGYNRATGFLWLKQNKRYEHKFHAIGKTVAYDTEISAFTENRRMRKIAGIKSSTVLMWVKVVEMCIEDPSSGKVKLTGASGLSMSFPTSALEL